MPRCILKFFILLCLRIKVVKVGGWSGTGSRALVCLDGEDSQVFACHVEARHRPGFESVVGVTSNEAERHVSPCFVDFGPRYLSPVSLL